MPTAQELWDDEWPNMVVYTKCNQKINESIDGGSYRDLWGVLKGPNKLEISILGVVRNGYITMRGYAWYTQQHTFPFLKPPTITIDPSTQLCPIGGKRIPVP